MPETEVLKLNVRRVIGTGDPLDSILLIPLIADWGVPRECIWSLTGERCEEQLARLYVLEEPVQGFSVVGACAKHHAVWSSE